MVTKLNSKIIAISWAFTIIRLSTCLAGEKLTIASPEDLPPKIYKENGILKGTYVEIIQAVCKRMNCEPDFQLYPWARAIAMVKSGEIDAIFPPLKNKEREEYLIFPSEPMSYTRNVIFGRKNSGLKIDKLSDLKHLVIGINDQYSYGEAFDDYKKFLNLDVSRTEELQIKKLANKSQIRMDVAAASEEAFLSQVKRLHNANDFEILYTISENPSYVAFSKAGGKKANRLAKKFSETLGQLKKEGLIDKINEKYFK